MKYYLLSLLSLFFIVSCNKNAKEENTFKRRNVKVVEAKGYVVPKDSMAEPTVIAFDESKLKKIPAGKPKVVPANQNVHPVGEPKVVLAGKPRVITPGTDTFTSPKVVPAIDSPFVAGVPTIILAKDRTIKDQNPANFSSYSKLQGLKSSSVRTIFQDNFGNIWFGTIGGGVTKYDGKTFTHFTEKEGLGNNSVVSILQDRKGNLWFGTLGKGVTKYNGKTFTQFTKKEGLSNNSVWNILEDKVGNLWFGTDAGIIKYDGKSFMHFTTREGLIHNTITGMIQDENENIWFCSEGGVSKYDGKSFSHFTTKEGLNNNFTHSILKDADGNLWFGTYGGGVTKYDGKNFTHFTEKEGLSNTNVYCIVQDKYKNLWFGTYGGGVIKYDGKSFSNYTIKEGLCNNIIISILHDKSGNLWFGTLGAGVSKYDCNGFTHLTEKDGLSSNIIQSILQDKSGNLWLGTFGGGVTKYDGKNFSHFTDKEGLCNNIVQRILQDKNNNLWFCTAGGGVSKYDGKNFTHFTLKEDSNYDWIINSLTEDISGNLWFGTFGGGVIKYDRKSFTHYTKKEGLSDDNLYSSIQDKNGNLWFGTYSGGVTKYDGKTFTHFTKKEGLSSNTVSSILQDNLGNLWFGTLGKGVTKYDGKFFTNFDEEDGLINNNILSILQDKRGDLWFGTTFGLSKISREDLAVLSEKNSSNTSGENGVIFKNFSYEDGFLGIGCNRSVLLEDDNATLWIGTNDRLTVYHPEGAVTNTTAPNIQLNTIGLFNEKIDWASLENKKDSAILLGNGITVADYEFDNTTNWNSLPENLSLAYYNNYINFNFIGITMNQPQKIKYQYILEGNDQDWSALTSANEAHYGNLPHGRYTFKVKAMNSEGVWSKPFEYTFTIRPPWWKTWWAYSSYLVIMFGSLLFFIKWRERKLKVEKEILEKTVEERTAEVVEQRNLIEEKHKEITDSINYAERIQRSFLATKEVLDVNLNDYFIFFQPKDVVSGDFYWASSVGTSTQSKFLLCVADSTGHGVPGAIMSILNITTLELAIKEKLIDPSEIFNYSRKEIITRLRKDGSAEGGKDGMDASLIVFNSEKTKLTYSAANNPIWIIRKNEKGLAELIEAKPDKMPIGKHDKDQIPFTQHEIDLQKGDLIYLLTDGMPDQFGGPKGKKYKYTQLKEFLISISSLSMNEQHQQLKSEFERWKGELEQVDDVTLIGIRV